MSVTKEQLVQQVKEFQKSSPQARQSWQTFADEQLGTNRDPSRHDATILRGFLEMVATQGVGAPGGGGGGGQQWSSGGGAQQGGNGGGGGAQQWGKAGGGFAATFQQSGNAGSSLSDLAQMVKIGQRKSHPWKAAWEAYCSLYGNGKHDPSKYDEAHILGFVDAVGTLALSNLGGAVPVEVAAPQKRSAAAAWGNSWDNSWDNAPQGKRSNVAAAAADTNPQKAQLVDAIKRLGKRGPEQRQAWHDFCDAQLGGNRDPARHGAPILEAFLAQQGAGGSEASYAAPSFAHQGASPQPLIERVKAQQRASPQCKQSWHDFCDSELGGNRDPARHSAEVLESWLAMQEGA